MQRKNAKSPSSLSDGNTIDKSGKHDDEKKETVKSPKNALVTTDRPIITVIKAEGKEMKHSRLVIYLFHRRSDLKKNNCSGHLIQA